MVFLYSSQRNFGLRFGCNCLDYSLWLVLSLARFATMCAYIYFILPLVYESLLDTWSMSKHNWWKSADEPFLTNSSPFNAFLSWLFWFWFSIVIYLLMIYAALFSIILLIVCCTPKSNIARNVRAGAGAVCKMWGLTMKRMVLGTLEELAADFMGILNSAGAETSAEDEEKAKEWR